VYRDCSHMLNELKTAITACIRNISQVDLQKVFANKIKRSWTSLPTPFISAQRRSELLVVFVDNQIEIVAARTHAHTHAHIHAMSGTVFC
jgi:hypothetical protein